MAPLEEQRLHERIDGLDQKFTKKFEMLYGKQDDLLRTISTLVAQSDICRKMVMGNGHRPIGERLLILEASTAKLGACREMQGNDHEALVKLIERYETRLRIGWKSLTIIVSVAGLAFTALQLVLKYFS